MIRSSSFFGYTLGFGALALSLTQLSCGPETTYVQGQRIYEAKCANCHMTSGEGLLANIPPLAGAGYLRDHRAELACIIRYGQKGPISVNGIQYNARMGAIVELSDTEITNVLNYVLTSWGNDEAVFTPQEAIAQLEGCSDREKVSLEPEAALPGE